jgi:hypothetical protein
MFASASVRRADSKAAFTASTVLMSASEAVREPLARKRERGRGEGITFKGLSR